MNEMVERVARAICRSDPEGPGCVMDEHPDRPPCTDENCRRIAQARAAIEAMRDPPPAIICAVEDMAEERYNAAPLMQRWYGEDVWNAGIDAALGAGQAEPARLNIPPHDMKPEETQAQRESFGRHNVSTGDLRFD